MSNDIVSALKGLNLHGMASAWPEVLGTSPQQNALPRDGTAPTAHGR